MIILIIILIILICMLFYLSTIDNMLKNNYLLKPIHINLINSQIITYNTDREISHASTCFKYIVILSNKKLKDYTILKNILDNIDENVNVNDRWSKQIYIPREISISLFLLENMKDVNIMKKLFEFFLIWSPNPFYVGNTNVREQIFNIYSKCLSYIIMFKLNNKYSLNLNINEVIYNECLDFFKADLEILSCKTLSDIPGYYSDGSYTSGSPMIPAAIFEGLIILDNLLLMSFVLNIDINVNLLNSFLFMIEREINYYGCFIDTLRREFTRSSIRLQITQIIFQIGACIPIDIIHLVNTKILLKYPNLYNITSYLPNNVYPTLLNNVPYVKDNIKYFNVLTVNGSIKCVMNGFGITTSNYTSFCYVNNQLGYAEDLRVTTQFNRCCIQLTDPESFEYYFLSNNRPNGIIYNIQNILINDIMITPYGRDHAILGYNLNESEIFSAKGFTFENGRLQSYEILSDNNIISVNHLTLNSYNNIDNIKFIIFRWASTNYSLSENNTLLKISNFTIYTNQPIQIIHFNNYLIFYINIPISLDIIIPFSINRDLSSIIIRPDPNTICTGLFKIKERRENIYQQKYDIIPTDFDLYGTHYFELLHPIKKGFILYGPWPNVATVINNKDVNVLYNGVRYINL
ncbi:unknown similar to AMEV124 [Choristoneura biennis entomopoxvirus]|uniref:Uncharacterized protein n=1 Tax=Choristoneura biennis entomopoxvirus TaxID=10288 RepID=A0A916KPB4_CBEPV|nr:unknown similar to AMEV124 [Choristoneura biennis entomopoxvirus]CCU55601.1 unknown similar to AMEV124 [Choristoneura biennis entomopoxvirus]